MTEIKCSVIENRGSLGNISYSVAIFKNLLIKIESITKIVIKDIVNSVHSSTACTVDKKIAVSNLILILFNSKLFFKTFNCCYVNHFDLMSCLSFSYNRKVYACSNFNILSESISSIVVVFNILCISMINDGILRNIIAANSKLINSLTIFIV